MPIVYEAYFVVHACVYGGSALLHLQATQSCNKNKKITAVSSQNHDAIRCEYVCLLEHDLQSLNEAQIV